MTGLGQILNLNGVNPGEVVHIFHGTTIATIPSWKERGACRTLDD